MAAARGCEHPRAPRARARRALAVHRRPRQTAAAQALLPRHRRGRDVRQGQRHQEEHAPALLPRALPPRQVHVRTHPGRLRAGHEAAQRKLHGVHQRGRGDEDDGGRKRRQDGGETARRETHRDRGHRTLAIQGRRRE